MPDIGELAAEIKERVSAWEMGVQMGLAPNREGFCCCPFHAEKTGSLRLYKGRRGWYCYGCHAGGSVLDLAMRYYGIDLASAIIEINRAFNLGLPLDRPRTAQEKREADFRQMMAARKRQTDADLNRAVFEAFWLAGDFYNLIDAQIRSHDYTAPEAAKNENFWRLLKLREDARETMEDIAVYAIGSDTA